LTARRDRGNNGAAAGEHVLKASEGGGIERPVRLPIVLQHANVQLATSGVMKEPASRARPRPGPAPALPCPGARFRVRQGRGLLRAGGPYTRAMARSRTGTNGLGIAGF